MTETEAKEKYCRVYAEVDLDRIVHNAKLLREKMPRGEKFIAVVKADAYGHGAAQVAEALSGIADAYAAATAEEALRRSKETGAVVIEGLECTAGENVWSDFYKTVSKGEPASILVARYYTLDPARVSAELYEQEKDEYPKLFFYYLSYDGERYTVTVRESTEEKSEEPEENK